MGDCGGQVIGEEDGSAARTGESIKVGSREPRATLATTVGSGEARAAGAAVQRQGGAIRKNARDHVTLLTAMASKGIPVHEAAFPLLRSPRFYPFPFVCSPSLPTPSTYLSNLSISPCSSSFSSSPCTSPRHSNIDVSRSPRISPRTLLAQPRHPHPIRRHAPVQTLHPHTISPPTKIFCPRRLRHFIRGRTRSRDPRGRRRHLLPIAVSPICSPHVLRCPSQECVRPRQDGKGPRTRRR